MMKGRVSWFYGGLVIVMVLLLGRLATLQVVEAKYYQLLADENRVKLIVNRADRGVIYDRFGEILVRNTPAGRDYIYGPVTSHVLGFVGEISEAELEGCQDQGNCRFGLGEVIGKMGLEKQYDEKLRGVDGGVLVENDADGKVLREIGKKEPVSGESLSLSLDLGLQRQASELMGGRRGAVVASVPETGEILALVSSPSFDSSQLEKYLEDKDLPMFNRAVGGEYPPGSVFKIVTATAALEDNKIDETTKIEDTGEIKIGLYRFGNWYFDQYGRKEGELDVVRAIARSNDIFFYKLGEALGIEGLSDWAKYFGVGVKTGIDLPGEANGLMPNPAWKEEFWGESWYLGDTYISAIGQGNILMTPLQVNQMTSVIASRGKWCQPHLVMNVALQGGQDNDDWCRRMDISAKTLDLVIEGMHQVTETGGTAWPFFNYQVKGRRVKVAGKTGTAEFGAKDDKETHAWFSVMAPLEKPEIVVTVLLEAAGEGSDEAAPIAKGLLDYWFSRQ